MTAKHSTLTQERLKELLHYDPETGLFTWRIRVAYRAHIGDVACSQPHRGYTYIMIDGSRIGTHRFAWLYMFGIWPKDQIDHINGVRDDNRICNLREATNTENQQNRGISKRNTSGYAGVSFFSGAWYARIRVNRKRIHLGCFPTPELAHEAYKQAKSELHMFCPVLR